MVSCSINPLNAELNSLCHFLALLGAHPIFHVSRIRVELKSEDCRYFTPSPSKLLPTFRWSLVFPSSGQADKLQSVNEGLSCFDHEYGDSTLLRNEGDSSPLDSTQNPRRFEPSLRQLSEHQACSFRCVLRLLTLILLMWKIG